MYSGDYREYMQLRAFAKRLTSYTPEERSRLTVEGIVVFAQSALTASDRYYERYVKDAEGYSNCSTSVGSIYREARDDGAPERILKRIDKIGKEAARREGFDPVVFNGEPPF
ncbi:hypothetical protein [Streptomyces sp. 5-10]|uniref:hypothetical protein n=1 Tax=Streptomyces sp. 5-10 TaxID=878925 RepID=UPI00168B2BC5|nr:hypothetical protein [Streptomyces sp. 5-10]MBD3004809.1 hypothetical protein [Streptomyces sp. 5-10]